MPADPEEIESLGLTFTAGLPGIGEPVSMALCEDGDDVAVTVNNLREYVQAYADCILRTSVEKQACSSASLFWAVLSSQSCNIRGCLERLHARGLCSSHTIVAVQSVQGFCKCI